MANRPAAHGVHRLQPPSPAATPPALIIASSRSSPKAASSRVASACIAASRSPSQGRETRRHSSRYLSLLPLPARIAARSMARWKRSERTILALLRPRRAMTCAGMSRQYTVISRFAIRPSQACAAAGRERSARSRSP